MKNLLKSIFRSSKRNLILIAFFVILIFLAAMAFGALYGTSNSMSVAYNQLSQKTNLHDFTVSESYAFKTNFKYKIAKADRRKFAKYDVAKNLFISGWKVNLKLDLKEIKDRDERLFLTNIMAQVPIGQKATLDQLVTIKNRWIANSDLVKYEHDPKKVIPRQYHNALDNVKRALLAYAKQFKHQILIKKLRAATATNVNLTDKIKKTLSTTSFSTDITYKMIQYDPNTTIDALPNFNATLQDLYQNNTNFEKRIIDWIEQGQNGIYNKYIYIKNKVADINDDMWDPIKARITDPVVKNIIISRQNYGYKYKYELQQTIGTLFSGSKKLNSKGVTITNKAGSISFLRSYVAIANQKSIAAQGKTTIDPTHLKNLYEWWRNKKVDDVYINVTKNFDAFIASGLIPKSAFLSINGLQYILVGSGLTADFTYPIIDMYHPIPNQDKQMILYLSDSGISRYASLVQNSVKENYLVGTFRNTPSMMQKNQIVSVLNKIVKSNTSWDLHKSDDPVKLKNNQQDKNFIASLRIAYVERLLRRINIISIIAMVVVGSLSLFITMGIISKFISDRSVSLGIMRANGMSSFKIAWSIAIFVGVIAFSATLFGYFVGVFLQRPIFLIIGNFWTLPTTIIHFSVVGLATVLAILFGITFILSFCQVLFKMRRSSLDLIKNSKIEARNFIFKRVKKVFTKVEIKAKYGISLLLTSTGRLFGFMVSIIASTTIIIFAISSFNIFRDAKNKTIEMHNYNFKINLNTPTTSGGLYQRATWQEIGQNFAYVGQNMPYEAILNADQTDFSQQYQKMMYGTNLSTSLFDPFFNYYNFDTSPGMFKGLSNPIRQIMPDFQLPPSHDTFDLSGLFTLNSQKQKIVKPIYENIFRKMVALYHQRFCNNYQKLTLQTDKSANDKLMQTFLLKHYISQPSALDALIIKRLKTTNNANSSQFLRTIPYQNKAKQFRLHLPTTFDDFNVKTDIDFMHNMVETREFSNGYFGAMGGSGIFVSLYKNLWNWVYRSLPLSTPTSFVTLSENYALDTFNDHLAELTNEYNTSLARRIVFTRIKSNTLIDQSNETKAFTIKQILGHKVLVEHAYIKWKAFKDENGNLAVKTGEKAVYFDRRAAYNQHPENNPLWNGGFVNEGFIQDYNPYFALPVVSDTFKYPIFVIDDSFDEVHPKIIISRNMGKPEVIQKHLKQSKNAREKARYETELKKYQNAYSLPTRYFNAQLQNIYQHFEAPFDPILNLVTIGIGVKPGFYQYIKSALNKQIDHQFRLFYGGIPINNNELAYTYLKMNINVATAKSKFNGIAAALKNETIDIVGLSEQASDYIKLKDANNHDLYDEMLNYKGDAYPLVINKVLERLIDVKKGDYLSFDLKNHVRRNDLKYNINNYQQIKFKVVGITSTYKGVELYTSKAAADSIIGFDYFDNGNNQAQKFNGIISKSAKPKALYSSVLTYAKSGIYGNVDEVMDGAKISDSFAKFLTPAVQLGYDSGKKINYSMMQKNLQKIQQSLVQKGVSWADIAVQIPPENDLATWDYFLAKDKTTVVQSAAVQQFQNQLLRLSKTFDSQYGATLINSALANVTSSEISNNIFNSYTRVTNSFESIIIVFALVLVVIIVLSVTMMLITSNIKSFATLKILGYRKRDVSKIFLTIYLPFLFAGLIIGVIIAYFAIYLFVYIVLAQSQIFLPLYMTPLSVIIAIISLVIVFLIAFFSSLWSINRINPLKVLK